jgi:hypothetical protein
MQKLLEHMVNDYEESVHISLQDLQDQVFGCVMNFFFGISILFCLGHWWFVLHCILLPASGCKLIALEFVSESVVYSGSKTGARICQLRS